MRSLVSVLRASRGYAAGVCVLAAVAVSAQAGSVKAPDASHDATSAPPHVTHDIFHGRARAAVPQRVSALAAGHRGPVWGCAGATGPGNWSSRSKDFAICGNGTMQSPIDLSHFSGATVEPISFDYRLSPLEIVHNGHTIQINYALGSGIAVAGQRFELLQGHFHTPSEHTISGRQAPMELHLVHRSAAGELSVIGVIMDIGDENIALSEFWEAMPQQAGPARKIKQTLINPRDLLPLDTGYHRYMGSLTTPPCTEGVNRFVLRLPVSISAAQIERFAATMNANAHPVQPVNQCLVLAPLASTH